MRASWPTGQTVSRWPSSRTCPAPAPNSARRWSPAAPAGRRVTRAADGEQAPLELRAAPIDGSLVGGRRLEAHERLDRLDEPGSLGVTE